MRVLAIAIIAIAVSSCTILARQQPMGENLWLGVKHMETNN